MSAVKGLLEHRTVLDFSKDHVSKNLVRRALCQTEILDLCRKAGNITFIDNDIKVGMYTIRLGFSEVHPGDNRKHLRDYGGFKVKIFESGSPEMSAEINLNKDKRFSKQYWTGLNKNYNLLTKNLIDIILHCSRLNDLRVFL